MPNWYIDVDNDGGEGDGRELPPTDWSFMDRPMTPREAKEVAEIRRKMDAAPHDDYDPGPFPLE